MFSVTTGVAGQNIRGRNIRGRILEVGCSRVSSVTTGVAGWDIRGRMFLSVQCYNKGGWTRY